MKKCSKCGEIKPLSEFGTRKRNGKIRPLASCKKCLSDHSKEFYKNELKKSFNTIYRFLNKDNEILYIGKSKNLKIRINNHFSKQGHLPKKCYEDVYKIEFMIIFSTLFMDLKEIYFINKYKPKYNENYNNEETTVIIPFLDEEKWNNYDDYKSIIKLEHIENIKKNYKHYGKNYVFSRKRGNSYLVYIEVRDADGKKKQYRQASFKNKKDADNLVCKLKEQYENIY